MKTEVTVARVFLDHCLELFLAGELDATTAAMGKWWLTELDNKVLDTCLQLFGGYGYMLEYPIARAYADARVHRIYAGTTEIMKELVARGCQPGPRALSNAVRPRQARPPLQPGKDAVLLWCHWATRGSVAACLGASQPR